MYIRLFIEEFISPDINITLNNEQNHYLSRVMNCRVKQEILVFNEASGEWLAEIINITPKKLTLNIKKQTKLPTETKHKVILCFALLKNKASNIIVQKSSELGATLLQPVITEHTNIRTINLERFKKIATEASEQCERTDVANIKPPVYLSDLLNTWNKDIPLIMADESRTNPPIAKEILKIKQKSFGILIGPEGGFTDKERSSIKEKSFVKPVTMGARIMRADTAAISALACCQSIIGDWQ